MIKAPKKIKVGSKIYTVNYRKTVMGLGDASGQVYGHCNGVTGEINIALELDGETIQLSEVKNTLLHETFHAIYWHQGMQESNGKDEEYIVNTMANGLMTVMNDNPQLMEYLNRKDK